MQGALKEGCSKGEESGCVALHWGFGEKREERRETRRGEGAAGCSGVAWAGRERNGETEDATAVCVLCSLSVLSVFFPSSLSAPSSRPLFLFLFSPCLPSFPALLPPCLLFFFLPSLFLFSSLLSFLLTDPKEDKPAAFILSRGTIWTKGPATRNGLLPLPL